MLHDMADVLTGDLVASGDLTGERLDAAFAALARAARHVERWQDAPARLTRARGDGWQMIVTRPAGGLRAALAVTAALKAESRAFETRIAIATGALPASLGPALNTALGAPFTRSGRALDEMAADSRIAHDAGGALHAAARLADALSRRWTSAQAAALLPLLAPDQPTRAEVGAVLGITRQAVDKAVRAAGLPAIEDALRAIEAAP